MAAVCVLRPLDVDQPPRCQEGWDQERGWSWFFLFFFLHISSDLPDLPDMADEFIDLYLLLLVWINLENQNQ